jgi:hypothetical protein
VRRPLLIAWAAAVLGSVPGVASADGPPLPPPPETHGVLVAGQTVQLGHGPRLVPTAGALYLETPAWTYLVERQRRAEVELAAAIRVAERERLRAIGTGFSLGVSATGLALALALDSDRRGTGAGIAVAGAVLTYLVNLAADAAQPRSASP